MQNKLTRFFANNKNQMLIRGSAFIASLLVKEAIRHSYKKINEEEPPMEIRDNNFSWGKILIFTTAISLASGAIKLLVRDYVHTDVLNNPPKTS